MSIAEWRDMPKYEDYGDSGQMFKREFDLKVSLALRDRLRDTAAALDALLDEVMSLPAPYAPFDKPGQTARAILKRLKEEGLV